MADIKRNITYTAIPLTALAVAGIIMRKMASKDMESKREIKETISEALREIDDTVNELKTSMEGKSASQLERSLDSLLETTKRKLDRISSSIKTKIHSLKNRDTACSA
ncbi:MAG TPA: hypothetical protein PLE24_14750 [Chitinispirillaceae bacterium]|jgi:uncharacterized Zn finger protein (UPF0148 family)|nr:hypothetical protein [Chitinispirillaceae bacterium]